MLSIPEKRKRSSAELLFLALSLICSSNLLAFSPEKLLFLVPIVAFALLFRISVRWILLSTALSLILLLIQHLLLVHKLTVKGTYPSLLNRWLPIHRHVSDFLDRNYSGKAAELMGLVVFNRKGSGVYRVLSEFGIAHLVSVSGLHFSMVGSLLSRTTKRKGPIFAILLMYWAAIDYSIPALRVILSFLVGRRDRDKIREWSWAALLSVFANIHIYSSLSFLLSYFFSLLFILNREMFTSGLSLSMFNSLSAFAFSTLAFLPFRPHKIYPLSMVNDFIFAPIIVALFLYFLLTWFLIPLGPLHTFIAESFGSLNGYFGWSSGSIELARWDHGLTHIGLASFGLLLVIFLSVCCASTIRKTRGFWTT